MQRAMWPYLIVVLASEVELLAHINQGEERFHVQAFVPQPAVERLDIAILDGPGGPRSSEELAVFHQQNASLLVSFLVALIYYRGEVAVNLNIFQFGTSPRRQNSKWKTISPSSS